MENSLHLKNTVKGVEVLYFPEAEIEKYKGSYDSFGAIGPLSVLYFKDYNRFVLQINDFKYPLVRRLPIILTSDRNSTSHRTYVLPGLNGFSYQLKLLNLNNLQSLINFETILDHNSLFSTKGGKFSDRKSETSPDDKLIRHHAKETGPKEIITENVKSTIHLIKTKTKTLMSGTKYLTSTKRRIDLSKLKNTDYKKSAKSSFGKNFFTSNEKASNEFLRLRRENKNLVEAKDISHLVGTTNAPIHYVSREDLEEAILRNKDLVIQGNFMPLEKQTKTFMQNLKESVSNIKEMAPLKVTEFISSRTGHGLKTEKLHEVDPTHHSEA